MFVLNHDNQQLIFRSPALPPQPEHRSPTPRGGPWVTNTWVSFGIFAHLKNTGKEDCQEKNIFRKILTHLSFSCSPRWRQNADWEKSGCQGDPKIFTPITFNKKYNLEQTNHLQQTNVTFNKQIYSWTGGWSFWQWVTFLQTSTLSSSK